MENRLKAILPREEIYTRVKELGKIISSDYHDKELVLISVLRGSVYFAVDLSRSLSIPFFIDFISISRYGEKTEPTGVVRITKDLDVNIADMDVLVVEDIVDTGLSLSYLLRNLKTRNPKTLKVCTFLNVEARRIVNVPVDYKGFNLPDIYVVGYGLDHDEQYRNLQFVAEYIKE
ncbi:MAG: hypoxanthine phosphoribosyltransferase [Candidatus Contubernalis sp.]|nr:hypoxanthine phosphoribosyltransferase [Candidatus Contubernalis sp.]